MNQWRIWQLLDSAFPAGAMAHSGGLEAAWQAGWVKGEEQLLRFAEMAIEQAGTSGLPFVRAAMAPDSNVFALDEYLESYLSNHVANRASRQQGRAFLRTAAEVFGEPEKGRELAELWAEVLRRGSPGHLAVMFGEVAGRLDIGERVALRGYLYLVMRGVLSAGVRLGIVGPLAAQRLQSGLDGKLEETCNDCAEMSVEAAHGGWPLMEMWQMGQDRLYSRLFQS